jgi:hypothetical protein
MFITFDPKTLADFQARNVQEVFVHFISKGCEGTKVEVLEEFSKEGLGSDAGTSLTVYFSPIERERLEGSRVTKAGAKWIFTSSQVTGRCGCGSSFSFEKKLVDKSKLAKLRGALGGVSQVAKTRLEAYAESCQNENPSHEATG